MSSSVHPIGKPVPANCFKPLAWQLAPLRDKSQVLLLGGSAGGGKSRLAAEKVHAFCLKYPGSTWLILRKAAEWTRKSIIPFMWQTVIAGTRGVTYSKSEGSFHYTNGSTVYSGGMADDKQRESIRSIGGAGGLDGAWMEEANAFTRQDFEELRGRLRHTAADWRQLILTTNPGGSKHWINTDLIKGGGAAFYRSTAVENTHNPAEYVATLDSMTGMMRQRLALGLWINAEGAVYNTFDSTPGGCHVQDRPASEMRRWFLAMDEGYTNPAVILVVGEDGDGRRHVFREFYQRGVLQSAVCAMAKQWYIEFRCESVIVDDSAAGLIAELQSVSVAARPAEKGRVLDGIQLVQNALAVAGDGKSRLTVDEKCVETINELESYCWAPEKDVPIKENDHACFVAGTPVLTQRGLVAIERVTTADKVWSPLGWGRVFESECTGERGVKDYGVFESTSNHPVITADGIKDIESINDYDILLVWKSNKSWSLMGVLTAVIREPQTGILGFISAIRKRRMDAQRATTSTAMYGGFLTARSLMACTFTILTSIRGITTLAIWLWSRLPSTRSSTITSLRSRTWMKWSGSQKRGIAHPKAESGTPRTAENSGRTAATPSLSQKSAQLAEGRSRPLLRSASSVGLRVRTGLGVSSTVPDCQRIARVYNLATEHGCYFANGVLVSNCDALRYLFVATTQPTGAFDSRAIAQSTIGRQEIKADRLTMAEM